MIFFLKFKDFVKDFFKNIPRIFLKYFPQSNQKASECGSCYHVCTHLFYKVTTDSSSYSINLGTTSFKKPMVSLSSYFSNCQMQSKMLGGSHNITM